ncbi:MAG: hypothetical protein IIA87_01430 [Nanoarchaeota archaeon]|nr:hypothetical protein [Nanoarchaeota archaeon]
MKKFLPLVILVLFASSFGLAADLEVEKIEKGSVIIVGIDKPAEFSFIIRNNGITDDFEIYSLVGVSLEPKSLFTIAANSSKELEVIVTPHEETKQNIRGFYTFDYEIKGQKTGFFRDRLTIKIVELKDAIEIVAENIKPGDENVVLNIKNLEKFDFGEVKLDIKSPFFEFSDSISLKSLEQVNVSVAIKEEGIRSLTAGIYSFESMIEFQDIKEKKKGEVNYLEKGGLSVSKETSGLIIRKTISRKTNEGNVLIKAEITERKDMLTRLFTVFSEKPLRSERKGFFVEYSWEKELNPQESLIITSTTNYTFPFILLIIVILITVVVKIYLYTNLVLNKRVSFVKTKGGEFALKVIIQAKVRKPVENVKIIDRLPRMTKLYEKFGTKPDKIDEKTRRIFWHVKKLNAGEQRIFSYIIYSKIKVLGKFELPAAMGTYEKDGKIHRVFSNKTYFVAETSDKAED